MTPTQVVATGAVVGFTGTRAGMTPDQRGTLAFHLTLLCVREVHHGDCVGADAEFHDLCKGAWPIVIHPPSNPQLRAWCEGGQLLPEKWYLDRNRDIVDSCDVLIAAPKESTERKRGGTWYTINYARDVGRDLIIIWPDGRTDIEGEFR